jgi:hypothetical protein
MDKLEQMAAKFKHPVVTPDEFKVLFIAVANGAPTKSTAEQIAIAKHAVEWLGQAKTRVAMMELFRDGSIGISGISENRPDDITLCPLSKESVS